MTKVLTRHLVSVPVLLSRRVDYEPELKGYADLAGGPAPIADVGGPSEQLSAAISRHTQPMVRTG